MKAVLVTGSRDLATVLYEPPKGPCWEFNGSLWGSGYGWIWFNRKHWRTHRLAWLWHHGSLPADMCVLHKCDNRKCYRPQHLFLGTRLDNNLDRDIKNRARQGVVYWGGFHRGSKLSRNDVLAMRLMRAMGLLYKDIAEVFSMSRRGVSKVCRKVTHSRPAQVTNGHSNKKAKAHVRVKVIE